MKNQQLLNVFLNKMKQNFVLKLAPRRQVCIA